MSRLIVFQLPAPTPCKSSSLLKRTLAIRFNIAARFPAAHGSPLSISIPLHRHRPSCSPTRRRLARRCGFIGFLCHSLIHGQSRFAKVGRGVPVSPPRPTLSMALWLAVAACPLLLHSLESLNTY